jgi:muramoyltetrapeptide carboxypeptidase LdcA involved in peptidoglycan recycling
MKLILLMEDGTSKAFGIADTIQSVIRSVNLNAVKTIVFGEVNTSGKVVWEKQFETVDVLPSSFGKRK